MGLCCCCNRKVIDKSEYFGPNSSRKCRDIFWLIVFFLFWCGMIVVAVLGFMNGEIKHYYYGTDVYGNMCSADNSNRKYVSPDKRLDNSNKPYVYFPDIKNLTKSYCVEKCPDVEDVNTIKQITLGIGDDQQVYDLYPTIEILNRCIPDYSSSYDKDKMPDDSAGNAILTLENWFTRVVHDVVELWWLILICVAGAFVVGWLWLFFVRCFIGFITYTMIFVCMAAFIAATVYTWVIADNLNLDADNIMYKFTDDEGLRTALKVIRIILLVVTICLFFMLVFLRKRIKLAVAVIREASRAVRKTPTVTIFPIIQFLACLVFAGYWIIVLLFLASSYQRDEREYTVDVTVNGSRLEPKFSVMYLGIYHIFGGLWTVFFLSGVGRTTVSGVIAESYWTDAKKDQNKPFITVFGSLYRTLRYSTGSIAIGSLLMATVKFVRLLFEYFKRAKAKAIKKEWKFMIYLLKLVSCCIWCFEKVVRFVTSSAYIMIAIAGKGFCKSAMHALALQAKNFVRILVLKGISFFTLVITRLAIALLCTLAATVVSYNYSKLDSTLSRFYQTSELHFWYIPVILVLVGSFIVAGVFTSVYHVAIDTIMLSFCEDESSSGAPHNKRLGKLMKKSKRNQQNSDVEMEETKKSKKRDSIETN